jgi:hypothetical protein
MDEMLYPSITSQGVLHDAANMLTELIWLNRNLQLGDHPWKSKATGREWGQMVACIKKLMRDFEIDSDQLAFYIYKCRPVNIRGMEFGKMAVVAKKLLRRHDLDDLVRMYDERRRELRTSGIDMAKHKTQRPKSLMEFLKELEDGKA